MSSTVAPSVLLPTCDSAPRTNKVSGIVHIFRPLTLDWIRLDAICSKGCNPHVMRLFALFLVYLLTLDWMEIWFAANTFPMQLV